jgi:hypothetical protein
LDSTITGAEQARLNARTAQRTVLRRFMEDRGGSVEAIASAPKELRRALAGALLATWPTFERTEAVVETGYFEVALVDDLCSAAEDAPRRRDAGRDRRAAVRRHDGVCPIGP